LLCLLNVPPLKLALSAKCFIYRVVCWAYLLSFNYQSITNTNPLNRSTAVAEKISFKVGKKAQANRQALLQFLVVCWHVRIANVLGCVG
jgi:steroid 5-alpha reductase family enzyme